MTPFPPSGRPELLRTKEGVIFHFASKAIFWTADEGTTWADLEIPEWALKSVRYNREMPYRWWAPGSAYYVPCRWGAAGSRAQDTPGGTTLTPAAMGP